MQEQPKILENKYLILEEVRPGGMSEVHKASDIRSGKFYAVKRIKNQASNASLKESFQREYAALSELSSHSNIVDLISAGTDGDDFYLVLEWLPKNLTDLISERGPLSWREFFSEIGCPILEAIVYAQNRNWAHRDIKPLNILIADDGTPKLADYGIAKRAESLIVGPTFAQFRSAPYTPPEDDSPNSRGSRDCFSWAAVAVYCLTANSPSDYGELRESLQALDRSTVPVDVLAAALSDFPEERPPLASALLADVLAFNHRIERRLDSPVVVYLQFDRDCLEKAARSLEVSSTEEALSLIIDDLNEAPPGIKFLEDKTVRIFSISWILEFSIDRISDGIARIEKASRGRFSILDRWRENAYQPQVEYSSRRPPDSAEAKRQLEELLANLESYEFEERTREADAQRERVFRVWYAFLRAKFDYETRRENAIEYVDVRFNRTNVSLVCDTPPVDVIEESRAIKVPSGGYIFCDIVDTSLDEVMIQITGGSIERLPRRGRLTVNTVSAEKAIERQRRALDAVNYDRSVSPRLKQIILDPSTARPPLEAPPHAISDSKFDDEKQSILSKALGLQDVLTVQGPPGTGKTRLIEEIIVQYIALNPGHRVLISSQTHVALDNVIDRVHGRQPNLDIVRIGRLDDPKISEGAKELLLERKAQLWSERIKENARTYLIEWAKARKIDLRSIEIGVAVERLIHLLRAKNDLTDMAARSSVASVSIFAEAAQLLEETGTNDSPTIDSKALEAAQSEKVAQGALAEIERNIDDIRSELRGLGEDGVALSEQGEIDELREWSSMMLGDTAIERQCRELLELQAAWIQRVGKSSDFHAAMLASAQLVAGTCVGMAGVSGMNQVAYDLCIVDEASKATATEILVPMSRSRKWILVGDPRQLPPFFEEEAISNAEEFESDEIRRTLLDHLLTRLPDHSNVLLQKQHRMVRDIGDLISNVFYDGALVSQKAKPDVVLSVVFPKPVTWLSTAEASHKAETQIGKSFRNDTECGVILDAIAKINFIAEKRKKKWDIAVIAGYVAQVRAINDTIRQNLDEWENVAVTCSTVDAFQGNEAEICIYSVTRSNDSGRLGFLRERPRLNVALSRGRSALIIVGDDSFCRAATGENPFRAILQYIEDNPEGCEVRPYS